MSPVKSRRRLVSRLLPGVLVAAGLPVIALAAAAPAGASSPALACGAHGVFSTDNDGTDSCRYSPTNAADTFTVPASATSLHFDIYGAGGQSTMPDTPWLGGHCGGWQGHTWGDLTTFSSGQVFQVNVGGQGQCDTNGGWNGGGDGAHKSTTSDNGAGGSGATDIRVGGYGLSDRILVAAGGGGNGGPAASNFFGAGGSALGLTGADGGNGHVTQGGSPGTGGTQTAAGATPGSGNSAGFGFGGSGGDWLAAGGGGGGGGGWYGGGGGQGGTYAGGGGAGSAYVSPLFTNQGTAYNPDGTTLQTAWATISWNDPVPTTIAVSPTASRPGSIDLTATLTPSTATGTVSFWQQVNGSNVIIGSGTVSNGVADYVTSALPVGANTIVAIYAGDAHHQAVTQQSTLNVGIAPSITTQPADQHGSAADVLDYIAGASGTPAPTVQWQASTDNGATWHNLVNATSTLVDVTALSPAPGIFEYTITNGTLLHAVFTNLMGTATTRAASFSDLGVPSVTQNPSGQSLFPGNDLPLSAHAVADPAATGKWQVSTDNGTTWTDIAGATSDSYTVQNVTLAMSGYQYRAAYTNSYGTTYSLVATLTVTNPNACIVANPTPTSYSHCAGVDLHGADLHGINLNYADLTGANLSGTNLRGATFQAAKLIGANLSGAGSDRFFVAQFLYADLTGANLTGVDFSNTVLIGANLSNTLALPGSMTVDPQSSAGATVSWSDPAAVPGVTLGDCTPASGSAFSVGATTVNCQLINSDPYVGCSPAPCTAHGSFTVTVRAPQAPVVDPNFGELYDTSATPGQTVSYLSFATGAPVPSRQWQISTDNGATWTDIDGATGITYSFVAALSDSGHKFRAVYTNFVAATATTVSTLTVHLPYMGVQPDDQEIHYGDAAPNFTVQYLGLTPGDTPASVLTGTLSCDTQPAFSTGLAAGRYPIICSGLTSTSYSVQYPPGTLTVDPAPLSVTAHKAAVPYGAPLPPIGADVSGLVGTDTFAGLGGTCGLPGAPPRLHAGPYLGALTCWGITSPNYAVTYTPADLFVTPAPLIVTAHDASMTYGGALPTFDGETAGLVAPDTFASLGGSCSGPSQLDSFAVGSYPSVISCAVSPTPDYQLSVVPGTLTVDAAKLIVTAHPKAMVYGGSVPVFDADVAGLVGTDTFAGLGGSCGDAAAAPTLGAGTYTGAITCAGVTSPNYVVSYHAADLTVQRAPLQVVADDAAIKYGQNLPAFSYHFNGFVNGQQLASSDVTGSASCGTTATSASAVGVYPITCTVGSLLSGNYSLSFTGAHLSIGVATLTVTASGGSSVYGAGAPSITPQYSGFVNHDDASVVTSAPSCSAAVTAATPVGTYPGAATCTGGAAANYTLAYTPGSVMVTPATLTVTASNGSSVYGAGAPSITPQYSGFVNHDDASAVTSAPSCSAAVTAATPVGTYPVAATCTGGAAANYTLAYAPGSSTVTPATLVITASNGSSTYGQAAPVITARYSGFVNSQDATALTTLPTCSANTSATTSAGLHAGAATCSGAAAANYAIQYAAGNVTVVPAVLTVRGTNANRVFGAANPAFQVTITGYANGEGASVVQGAPALSTTAVTSSHPGAYPITVGLNTLTAANYTFALVNGTLTVTQAAVHVVAVSVSAAAAQKAGSMTLSATVTNATTGAPVAPGTLVSFVANTAPAVPIACTATTNASGVASCSVASRNFAKLKAGAAYTASVAATQDYLAGSGTAAITTTH